MSSTGGSRERESVLVALRSVLHRGQFLRAWVRATLVGRQVCQKKNDIPRICLFHDFGLDECIETLLYVNLTVLGRWYRQG
jgi:hypothetical protein